MSSDYLLLIQHGYTNGTWPIRTVKVRISLQGQASITNPTSKCWTLACCDWGSCKDLRRTCRSAKCDGLDCGTNKHIHLVVHGIVMVDSGSPNYCTMLATSTISIPYSYVFLPCIWLIPCLSPFLDCLLLLHVKTHVLTLTVLHISCSHLVELLFWFVCPLDLLTWYSN